METGLSIRLTPHPDVRLRAREYAPEIKKKYYAQLKGYQVMPETELFTFQDVVLAPALEEIISRPGLRSKCVQCGEEIINERQVIMNGKSLCRTCAGESYYQAKETRR